MNSADRAHRVLSATIQIPSHDHWYVYCAADLAESDHIRACETIVGSIRFDLNGKQSRVFRQYPLFQLANEGPGTSQPGTPCEERPLSLAERASRRILPHPKQRVPYCGHRNTEVQC